MSGRLQPALLALAGAVALGAVVVLLAGFVWPDLESDIDLGSAEAFPRGSVTSFYLPHGSDELRQLEPGEVVGPGCARPSGAYFGGFGGTVIHLVRDEEGEFIAFSGTSSHLGGMVPWYPERRYDSLVGVFMEPCHNETWARDGTRVFGPAPRDLDRFALRLDEGRVIVDPTDVTEGERPPPPPPWDNRTPAATAEATQRATPVATFMPTSPPTPTPALSR